MKRKIVGILCCIAVLGLSVTAVRADGEDEALRKPKKVVKPVKKAAAAKKKPGIPFDKLVDINSATKAELKKLPGITDELADRIIAGRPYGSKAWLTTKNIIPAQNYDAIRQLIAAKNPQAALPQAQQKGAQKK